MKGYEVTVDLPNLPAGAEVQVSGLGILKNGETSFVTDEQANHWRAMNATLVGDFDENGQHFVEEERSGTLLQVLGKAAGFTVSKAERPDETEGDVETVTDVQEQLPLDQQTDGGEQS